MTKSIKNNEITNNKKNYLKTIREPPSKKRDIDLINSNKNILRTETLDLKRNQRKKIKIKK